MTWAIADIADAVEAGLRREADAFDREQAVYGLDTLSELELHPLLVSALKQAGFGVHREERYPADRCKRSESCGERCDIVLTPAGCPLAWPAAPGIASARALGPASAIVQPTLFEDAAPPAPARACGQPAHPPLPPACQLEDAFWLEVKVVSQFTIEGPNRSYSSQLLSTVRQDVTKLSKDPGILHAGLLNVHFAIDERVARHDLAMWIDRCLQRGLPIAAPSTRIVPITDRIGNAVCAIAACPVSHL
jgi:hypothetical protein